MSWMGADDRRYTGRPAKETEAEHKLWAELQPTFTRCLFCDWHHEGTALEGRQAAAHRRKFHPKAKSTSRSNRGKFTLSPREPRTADMEAQREDAMVEVEWRRTREAA